MNMHKNTRPSCRALKAARVKLLKPQTSTNNRFKQAKYGMKHLTKVERSIQEKLKRQAKRYKSYPGEPMHADTKRLPPPKGRKAADKRDYLSAAIGGFPRGHMQPSRRTKPQTVLPSS